MAEILKEANDKEILTKIPLVQDIDVKSVRVRDYIYCYINFWVTNNNTL